MFWLIAAVGGFYLFGEMIVGVGRCNYRPNYGQGRHRGTRSSASTTATATDPATANGESGSRRTEIAEIL